MADLLEASEDGRFLAIGDRHHEHRKAGIRLDRRLLDAQGIPAEKDHVRLVGATSDKAR
ncbi:hypothetical protein D3C72_2298350 [compost metagenome]